MGIFVSGVWAGAPPAGDLAGSIQRGEAVYMAHCAVCHGDQGDGKTWAAGTLDPPPRNFTDPKVIQTLTRERMRNSIRNGRPGTAMQPWKHRLSSEEIEAVIDYIRATFMKLDVTREHRVSGTKKKPERTSSP